ncbi:hypothetical protein GCM10008015_05910 [Flavobacterium palustre]|uniref:Lipoprotein n=1 Tax=Flavobacterium palustre TaxID=1476463 RepID=A0ABQ1HAF4_9FLAO|nr:hypothetical protein [Flavobacterium palustre]GGA67946.1 hypothetical protein GCM10008015_05910 [Flavobacterium palustre]
MKRIKLLSLIAFSLFCFCSKKEEKPNYKYFEFSFDNTFGSCFSLKFRPNDSIYIREHWNSKTVWDSISPPREKTNYIAIISQQQRKVLNYLISKIQLKKCDSIYYENYVDGRTYSIFIDKDSVKKLIKVHSYNNVPNELDSLGAWLYQFKTKAKLIETTKKLDFITAKYVLPPPPPLPIKK